MLFEGHKPLILPSINDELLEQKGFLKEEEARISFCKYLRYNPGIAVEMLTGIKLYPFQRLMIRSMFAKDFFLAICSRGLSKSFTAGVFCFLFAIFNPGSSIGLISGSFRQIKLIFKSIEKLANSREGGLLKQCLTKPPSHGSDIWEMEIGTSKIVALPLGDASKLRGFRFNVMVIDELLLIPENIINEVILPFLSVNFNPTKRADIRTKEDKLISLGLMRESDRTVFANPKFIGLSSASYKFEFLYKMYSEYVEKIYDPKELTNAYGIMQLACEVAPPDLYNEDTITQFRSTLSKAAFEREFGAKFTDDSGGYFSKKAIDLCTVPMGEEPTVEIVGESKSQYLLSVDPSWSKSEASDHFAMGLFKLDPITKTSTLVHNYAVAGGETQNHIKYFRYLLTNFNIVYVCIDNAGAWVLDYCNSSTIFSEVNLKLDFFDADFEDENYMQAVSQAKRNYNLGGKKIVYKQLFSAPWIRKANEFLSASFDHKRIFFAAPMMDDKFEKSLNISLPNDLIYDPGETLEGKAKMSDFIEHQKYLIDLVKDETCLIEINQDSDSTTHKFRLPQNLRRSTSPDKARKDNYTTLLMGAYATKCYFDMMYAEPVKKKGFVPFSLG